MQLALEKGLNTILLATVGALVNSEIVNQFAKQVTFPYVIFIWMAGGDTNQQRRRQGDFRYTIKAVVQEGSDGAFAAAQLADVIDARLHEQTFPVEAPWKVYRSQRMSIVKYTTSDNKRQFFHHGGIYRFRVSEEF